MASGGALPFDRSGAGVPADGGTQASAPSEGWEATIVTVWMEGKKRGVLTKMMIFEERIVTKEKDHPEEHITNKEQVQHHKIFKEIKEAVRFSSWR